MAVEFQNGHFQDNNNPINLEESMRLCGAYAGIHDYDFENLMYDEFDNLNNWSPDALGTYVIDNSRLSITGAGDARYYICWNDETVDPSFVISVDLVSGPGQITFLGSAGGACFSAWWTTTSSGFAQVAGERTATNLISLPVGITGPSRIQLVVKYSLDINGDIKWLQGNLFSDGKSVVGFTKNIESAAYSWVGSRVGLSATDANNVLFDNFTVSAFSRIVDWTTIDIGDNAASGTSRAVGSTRLARQARFDSTARIWRPGNRDSDWTPSEHRPVKVAYRNEKTEVVTHVRTRGVLYQADVFNDDEGRVHLHRFLMTDDPNLFSKEETQAEATKVLHNEREKQRTAQIDMPPNPALEPHDRIFYDGENWRVTGIQRGYIVSGAAVVPKSTINVQRYIEQ
jgi:hypothetical protein